MMQNKNKSRMADDKGLWNFAWIQKFIDAKQGTTAIEYALIAAGISVVIIAGAQSIGVNLTTIFTSVQSGF